MRYYHLFILAAVLISCGKDSGEEGTNDKASTASSASSTTYINVSDGYVLGAVVTSGTQTAQEYDPLGAGWYRFEATPEAQIVAAGGVNDIVTVNGLSDAGEPYAPTLRAPAGYGNVTPLTTMLLDKGSSETAALYPNAYAYDNRFDFDVVAASLQNLAIAKENAKAAIELSYPGTTVAVTPRIIDGQQVASSDDTWQFVVSLQLFGQHYCGGSLIDPEWVVTAGHCVTNDWGQVLPYKPTIMAGSYSLSSGGVTVQADALYVHPSYNPNTLNNDVGLIHLSSPITSVTPIALAQTLAQTGEATMVAGWGDVDEDDNVDDMPDDLMAVTIPVIDYDICNASYWFLTDSMFCAGYMAGGKDSCSGDSGGPLIALEEGEYRLNGLVSFGGSEEQLCGAPDYPGVYTDVTSVADWIGDYVDLASSSSSSRVFIGASSVASVSSESVSSEMSSASSAPSSVAWAAVSSKVVVKSSAASLVSSVSSGAVSSASLSSVAVSVASSLPASTSSSTTSSSADAVSSSASSAAATLDTIFAQIDAAADYDALNVIVVEYLGRFNGTYEE